MSARKLLAPLAGVVALALVAVAATVDDGAAGAAPRRTSSQTLPVRSSTVVCPDPTGAADAPAVITVSRVPRRPGAAQLPVTVRPLPTRDSAPGRSLVVPNGAAVRTPYVVAGVPLAITATGAAADTLAAQQYRLRPTGHGRALLSTTCLPPGTDWWFTGADGRVGIFDSLLLANPGAIASNLTVTAWAATGPLQPPGLSSYTLPAGRTARLDVADYAPDAALVALHIHANSGRIAAQILDRRVNGTAPIGSDWLPPSVAPATDAVVPGVPAGDGSRRLVLVNPGAGDATVELRLSTAAGNYIPAGHPNVVVRAGRTAEVDLTDSFAGDAGAVVLHSDVPVTAAAQVQFSAPQQTPDLAWLPASAPLAPTAVLPDDVPPFRDTVRLHLTAPAGSASVRITTGDVARTVAVRAGRTVTFDPEREFGMAGFGPLVLTPIGDAPVYASRLLEAHGDHGPLATTTLPFPLPQPVPLPDAREDLRAALP